MYVDLNCDMGESFGVYTLGLDEQVMPMISSANVACGFHAGDPQVMARSVALASRCGVAVGAHVSFPDLVGFGRREMAVSTDELISDLLYQLGALSAFCRSTGTALQHVKPHGALYNMAGRDLRLAQAVVRAMVLFDPSLLLFAQPGTAMAQAAQESGVRVACEVFADRAYMPDGSLASRKLPGSVIHDAEAVAARAAEMVTKGTVAAIDGSVLHVTADTVCVHGDTPGAVELIRHIRQRLTEAGVGIRAPKN